MKEVRIVMLQSLSPTSVGMEATKEIAGQYVLPEIHMMFGGLSPVGTTKPLWPHLHFPLGLQVAPHCPHETCSPGCFGLNKV